MFATTSFRDVLKSALDWEFYTYDYILIDCPPNLGLITQNGIEISDFFLIPVIPDILSTYGFPQILDKIHHLKQERNLSIIFLGLLMTKYLSNSKEHKRVKDELPSRFAEIVKSEVKNNLHVPVCPIFTTVMPQANNTAEAMTEKQLREYVRLNPQDEDAFQHYLSIIRSRPGRVSVSTDDEFEAELRKRINQQ